MLTWFGAIALAAPLAPGEAAPALEGVEWVTVPEGVQAPTSWDDLAGKVVVIDFWATWCGPCVAAWPDVERLAKTTGDDVVVMALSDEIPAKVRIFLERRGDGATKLVGADAHAVSEAWGVINLPTYGVVGPDGEVFAIVGTVPTKQLLEAARSGSPPAEGRTDRTAATQSVGPSETSARHSWTRLGPDSVTGYGLEAVQLLVLASELISPPRHRYEVDLPERRWDIDVTVPGNQDRGHAALALVAEAWGVRITREPVTVDVLVIDGQGLARAAADDGMCDAIIRKKRELQVGGCTAAVAAYAVERQLGVAVEFEGMPDHPVALTLAWDAQDPVAAVSASLREQGFVVQTERRTLPGLVVAAR